MNAKEEILEHISNREVKYITVTLAHQSDIEEKIEGKLEEILFHLDFDYDSGYGSQYLDGCIWFEDGTWSERHQYDGSEYWSHHVCPPLPAKKVNKMKIKIDDSRGKDTLHLVKPRENTPTLNQYSLQVWRDRIGRYFLMDGYTPNKYYIQDLIQMVEHLKEFENEDPYGGLYKTKWSK
jgi:hypothetical protein